MYKKWCFADADKEYAKGLAEECDISPLTALILLSRGYSDPFEIEEFISDEIMLDSPFALDGIGEAAAKIREYIESGKKIAVYGDYDCDGVTATVIMFRYLCSKYADAFYVIPDREADGYGLNKSKIDLIAKMGAKLIITVDNGITATEEVDYANSLGMEVVVTDHHLPKEELPSAAAVVDPYICGDGVFKGLSGAGVAFKVICAAEDAAPEELIYDYADLVALGTVADVMPLCGENRTFVRAGLEMINNSPAPGIAALAESAGLNRGNLNSADIAFGLAPRINAAGRMGSADRAAQLLLTNDKDEAIRLAEEICAANTQRRNTEQRIFGEACVTIERGLMQYDKVIVVGGEGWHPGVVGIVAAKLTEKYGRPCIVLSGDGEEYHGSGRSIEGFSLFDALTFAAETTEKFGGHSMAAGVTLKRENISAFRNKINEFAGMCEMPFPKLHIDCKLKPSALSLEIVNEISSLEPFGSGNPVPVFAVMNVKLTEISAIGGGKHLRLGFERDGVRFAALLFGCSAGAFPYFINSMLDIVVILEENVFNGSVGVSVKIKDIRLSDADRNETENQIRLYERYKRGEATEEDAAALLPNRAQLGIVYNAVRAFSSVNGDRLIALLNKKVPYAMAMICTEILVDLGFLQNKESGGCRVYSAIPSAPKNDMNNSLVLTKLKKKAGVK